MKTKLYWRLALGNMWRNRKLYLPFLLGCAIAVFCLYTFCMMAFNPGIMQMRGGESLAIVLALGIVVMVIFTFFFMVYANSFLFKRRLKELGLYSVLGLEKRHVARMLLAETILSAVLALAAGLALGMLLGKLMFLFVQRLVGTPVPFTSGVSVQALIVCLVFFSAAFVLLLLINVVRMRLACPATLLMGAQQGEREPKSRWILALFGVACMVAGYLIAIQVRSPIEAIFLFFVAVILVILGTYALFMAGSILILKGLKRIKRFYYQRNHFITVSGMLYRMKQHAAGLATICILSTMVIITLGTTVALYTGQRDVLLREFPYQLHMRVVDEDNDAYATAEALRAEALAQHPDVSVAAEISLDTYYLYATQRDGRFDSANRESLEAPSAYADTVQVTLLTQSEYARAEGAALGLQGDELAVFRLYGDAPLPEVLTLGGREYPVRTELETFLRAEHVGAAIFNEYVIVCANDATLQQMLADLNSDASLVQKERRIEWDLAGDEAACTAYSSTLAKLSNQTKVRLNYQSQYIMAGNWKALSAGFLFLGLFIGLMFLMATALIIYFKQVSEGYNDHDRFIILQKVGMDKAQVKSTVNRQILSVFLLPLLVAGLHTVGASNMMRQLLAIFGLGNTELINLSILLTGAIFAVVYGSVYLLTSRAYYKLVKWD